jgi:hypothetical protein
MQLIAVDEHITNKLPDVSELSQADSVWLAQIADLAAITQADALEHAKFIEDAQSIPYVGQIKEWFNNTKFLVTKVLTFNDGEEVCVFGKCVQ